MSNPTEDYRYSWRAGAWIAFEEYPDLEQVTQAKTMNGYAFLWLQWEYETSNPEGNALDALEQMPWDPSIIFDYTDVDARIKYLGLT